MTMIARTPRRRRRLLLRFLAILVALPFVAVGGYVAYLFMNYHRLPDSAEQHSEAIHNRVKLHEACVAVTWNVGFGAYSADFSFFMDGGEESRARSEDAVKENLGHAVDVLTAENPDFVLFQEVDTSATRSWYINEADLLRGMFPNHQNYFARNYNSPYILYPFNQPFGRAQAGLLTLSSRDINRGERHSLPVETGFMKLLDLDRCYTIVRVPTENGRQLCLYNLHLSAYTTDGSIATQQLALLLTDMMFEYKKGNYCVAGGDFNKDLLGHSDRIFGVTPKESYSWAKPIDRSMIPEGVRLVNALDRKHPIPSCRNCDTGYQPGVTYVLTVDGFIVSDNVSVIDCRVIDDGFTASDHNPVKLTFQIIEETEDARNEVGPYKAVYGI